MVKMLVLVRHGVPEAASASGSDFDRRLTPSGARALETAYPHMFGLLADGFEPTIWSSPAVRALETARIVADALDAPGVEAHDSLYAQDLPAFLDELDATDVETVVAVGHAPFVDLAATHLLGTAPSFDKGSVAAIELPGGPRKPGRLLWFVAGPDPATWEGLSVVEEAIEQAAVDLAALAQEFLAAPGDAEALRSFRVALRRVRSLLEFLEPWQSKKQNHRCEHVLKELQVASARLRSLDILARTVADLVEGGELAENSLLPLACSKERALECSSLLEFMRAHHAMRGLSRLSDDLSHLRWKTRVLARGLTERDFQSHFDDELAAVDGDLFGLDLCDGNAVFSARRDAKEMHYVAERLGAVLGSERAQMSEYMDEIQVELGDLSDARRNQRLAEELARSPRFGGVRADLGVVARDQSEVVSAITSGLKRLEVDGRPGKDR